MRGCLLTSGRSPCAAARAAGPAPSPALMPTTARNSFARYSARSGARYPPDRAPHVDGPVELQCVGDLHDRIHQQLRGQAILRSPPRHARWGHRLAVVRQVVRDQAESFLDFRVFEQMPPLPAIGTRGVLEHDGDALPRFLVVDAILHAMDANVHVASDGRIKLVIDLLVERPRPA
jgi:hypothetical protein